jgi:hypothetical protein
VFKEASSEPVISRACFEVSVPHATSERLAGRLELVFALAVALSSGIMMLAALLTAATAFSKCLLDHFAFMKIPPVCFY